MRDLLISPGGGALANWVAAFPKAKIYPSLPLVKLSKKDAGLFWLHANADSQGWIAATIAEILRDFDQPKIVVLANTPSQAEALQALGQGVVGYCHAYSPSKVLTEVRTVVTHDGIWLGRELLQHLITVSTGLVSSPSPDQVSETLALLTPREKDVALQAAKGLSNKEIARLFNITERTVKAHLSATFERLGVRDRLQLALKLNAKD